jgi:hypothetical protein
MFEIKHAETIIKKEKNPKVLIECLETCKKIKTFHKQASVIIFAKLL